MKAYRVLASNINYKKVENNIGNTIVNQNQDTR